MSYGADRDRTGDPRLAKPVLSQLSYNPDSETEDADKDGDKISGAS